MCKGIWKLGIEFGKLGSKFSQFAMTLDFDLSNLDPLLTIKCSQDSHPHVKSKLNIKNKN
jgi:hypothetical protein